MPETSMVMTESTMPTPMRWSSVMPSSWPVSLLRSHGTSEQDQRHREARKKIASRERRKRRKCRRRRSLLDPPVPAASTRTSSSPVIVFQAPYDDGLAAMQFLDSPVLQCLGAQASRTRRR